MSSLYKLTAFALAAVSLTGCAEVAKVRTSIENEMPIARQGFDTPAAPAAKSRVQESDEAFIPVSKSQFTRQKSSWLMAKRMEFTAPTPQRISNFVAALAEKGINVIYDMPLDSYTYTGTLSNTDAENAMRIVLGSAGLDYEVDDVRQIVTIKPLPVKTWTLTIGNRRTNFSSGQISSSTNQGTQAGNNSQQSSSQIGTNGSDTSNTSGSSLTNSNSGAGNSTTGTNSNSNTSAITSGSNAGAGVQTDDDFGASCARSSTSALKL
jgi:hypothetical protein